jgi:hypothetical protein
MADDELTHDQAPSEHVELCSTTWPLEDPNLEDRALRRVHRCNRPELHPPPHRCRCGHTHDDGTAALSRLLVALGHVVRTLDLPYPEPDGYADIDVVVPFTLRQARACYPALHRLLLHRNPPTDAELYGTPKETP